MGNGETGGTAALPIWIGFMEQALKGVPESWMEAPSGLVSITANGPDGKAVNEFVYKEHLPPADDVAPEKSDEPVPAPVQDATPKGVDKSPEKPR
jgi:penicillin-binding protein 1A